MSAARNAKINAFVRDVVIQVFAAIGSESAPRDEVEAGGLQRLSSAWHGLTDAEREELTLRVTGASELTTAALPLPVSRPPSRRARRKRAPLAAKSAIVANQEKTTKREEKAKKKNKKKNKKKERKQRKKDKKNKREPAA